MTSKGVKEGPKGSKKCQNLYFSGKIKPNRSISGVGWSRPGRAEVEGLKPTPGGPGEGHRGPKMAIYDHKMAKIFAKFLVIILVTPTTLVKE